MVKIAIFASGNGGNFERIVEAERNGESSGYKISLLIVDKKDAYAIKRAKNLGIKWCFVDPKCFSTKAEFEKKIISILEENKIDFVVLAGYMRIISSVLLDRYPNKIVNIHPAYLPEFPGRDGIGDAFLAGATETGVTIHYIDSGVDTGKIIYQERVKINPKWDLKDLEEEIHRVEHRIYPMVLTKLFKEGERK